MSYVEGLDIVVGLLLDICSDFAEHAREEAADEAVGHEARRIGFGKLPAQALEGFEGRICDNGHSFAEPQSCDCSHAAPPQHYLVVVLGEEVDDCFHLLRLPIAESDGVFFEVAAAAHEVEGG